MPQLFTDRSSSRVVLTLLIVGLVALFTGWTYTGEEMVGVAVGIWILTHLEQTVLPRILQRLQGGDD